ncbi:hypothetical protein [Streptomyces sp. NPDC051546]|uniref:hypothetical protein n=1 Tax=Streptomyces sp. NPDC051546 TaxID=3365655 RepID=UPI00379FDF9B
MTNYLKDVVTEASREADYQVDARDLLAMLHAPIRTPPGEEQPPAQLFAAQHTRNPQE